MKLKNCNIKGEILNISGVLTDQYFKLQQMLEDTNEEISERELDDDEELMGDLEQIEMAIDYIESAFNILDEVGGLDG